MNVKQIGIIAVIVIIVIFAIYYGATQYSDNEIKIGYLPSDHNAALFVANSTGAFEKAGIKVKLIQFTNAGDIINGLSSGDLDLGYVGITPASSAISKGIPIKVVSGVQLEGSGIVASDDSNINSLEDLKGKTVATPGETSIQNMLIKYALRDASIDEKDVDIVGMNVFSITSALSSNKIDAYISYEPFVTMGEYKGIGKEIMTSGEILPGHPCCVIVAREDFIKNNPEDLKTILKIHENATKYVNAKPEKAAEMMPKELLSDIGLEKLAMKNVKYVYGLDEKYKNNVIKFTDIEYEMKIISKKLTKEDLFI